MTENTTVQRTPRKAALAAWSGSALEYYDLAIYGTAAALVFPKIFFPEGNQAVATVASLATFGGPVTPENSSPFTHPFTPTARSVIINLRADTTQGYITFVLLDPHGRPIGQISGGGLTQRGWTLPIARPGLPHTLTVTPHTARGTYQAEIFQR